MPKPTKRVNKSKEQIEAEMAHVTRINRDKQLVKLMFPFISGMKSVYDAQTALNALAGYLKVNIDKKLSEVKVSDVAADLSKEEDSEIKSVMIAIQGLIEHESARDVASLLERFGNTLAQFSANEFMKQPMSSISVDKIISE